MTIAFGPPPSNTAPWWDNTTRIFSALIAEHFPFAFSNYGDGEWRCILGHGGATCDGTAYTPEIKDALIETLMRPVGQWCGSWAGVEGHVVLHGANEWIEKNEPPVFWVTERPFNRANLDGKLNPLFVALRSRRVVLVGPPHLAHLTAAAFKPVGHIEIPEGDAWQATDEIVETMLSVVGAQDVVLFSAGLGANLMIHKSWPRLRGRGAALIDIGSVLDPYCGVFSRTKYKLEHFQREVMPRNLQ